MNPADIVERLRRRGRELTQVGDGTLQGLVLQAADEIEWLRVVAQIRYELLRECQSEFRARGATGLVETIEAVLKEKQHEPG